MPTLIVSTNQAEEEFWAAHHGGGQQGSGKTVFRKDDEEIRTTKRVTGSFFDSSSLFAKFEQGLTPTCMPTTPTAATKTEDVGANQERPVNSRLPACTSPNEHAVVVELGDDDDEDDYVNSSIAMIQKLSKLHNAVIDGALYTAWNTDPVSRPSRNLHSNKSWGIKRTKHRLQKTRAAACQERPVNSRLRAFVAPLKHVVAIERNNDDDYDYVFASITKMQKLSKLHNAAMDGALYEA
jgi:hypothetical protein